MNTRIATVLIGGIAALGLAAVADAKITRLTLTEVETTRILVVDAPPMQASESQPPNAGDVVAGRAKLMRGSKTVGSAEFFGVVTAFPLLEFHGTFTLPGGRVSVVDVGSFTARKQALAIVGGTGRYVGARGVDVETRISEGKTRDVFTIITCMEPLTAAAPAEMLHSSGHNRRSSPRTSRQQRRRRSAALRPVLVDDRRDDEEEGGQPDHVGVGARLLVLADYQQHHAVRGEDGERERERREKRSGVSRQKCRKNVAITKHGHRASSEHE
jgi:hypothetical protein